MQSMIRHLHGFVREIQPTEEEWMAAIEWLTRTGKQSNDKRQEFILASDVVGVSMLVDCINHRLSDNATPTTVTGPFHVHNSPDFADGADIAKGAPGEPCYITGSVRSLNGTPIAGAMLDIWQADGEGLYDAQRGGDEPWMRGIFRSGNDGRFVVQTVLPVPYSIPMDGSVGELMGRTEISPMRPSHIHFLIEAEGHRPRGHASVQEVMPLHRDDVVYGVKAPLIAEFKLMPAGSARRRERSPISRSGCSNMTSCCSRRKMLWPLRRRALRPETGRRGKTGRKLALPSRRLAAEFGVERRAQPLIAGVAVEPFMPILRDLEFRQFNRRLRKPHVEFARQHGRDRTRHGRHSHWCSWPGSRQW